MAVKVLGERAGAPVVSHTAPAPVEVESSDAAEARRLATNERIREYRARKRAERAAAGATEASGKNERQDTSPTGVGIAAPANAQGRDDVGRRADDDDGVGSLPA